MLTQNIDKTGRLIRGLGAALLLGGGFLALRVHLALSIAIWASAAFVLFEAARGWCALRACGIKTRY
jgi:hypothetical protein